jgi:ABC-type transport system substrate-binding protein
VQSAACDLLVLAVGHTGQLDDDAHRAAISYAVDRTTLANVIFQRQAEPAASLLPNTLTGYGFLFPVARDLARAQSLHGTASGAEMPLTLSVEDASATVQLAAERLALNLRDAGFRVQVVPRGSSSTSDLTLRRIHLESAGPQAALQQALAAFNQPLTDPAGDPATLYREESAFLATHQAVPLLYLPRAFAAGPRVRGLRLSAAGAPLLADVSLEDAAR